MLQIVGISLAETAWIGIDADNEDEIAPGIGILARKSLTVSGSKFPKYGLPMGSTSNGTRGSTIRVT